MLLWLLSAVSLAVANPCPAGSPYNQNTNMCYYYSPSPLPFAQAERDCVSMNGLLVKIQNGFENAFIAAFGDEKLANSSEYWIGGSYSHGNYMWIDWTEFAYTKWSTGQPVNTTELLCVAMQTNEGTWKTVNCDAPKPYVCEFPAAPEPAPCVAKCDDGWHYGDMSNFCYKWHGNNEATFDDAQGNCTLQNGQIASIHNNFELYFVQALHGYYSWTGIRYVNGDWTNADGTPVDYTPGWTDKSHRKDAGDCIVRFEDRWGETSCETQWNYVCKKPANY